MLSASSSKGFSSLFNTLHRENDRFYATVRVLLHEIILNKIMQTSLSQMQIYVVVNFLSRVIS